MNLLKDTPKILIVDDHIENIIAIERVLEDCNVTFIRALNGNEAVIAAMENEFAIILLDVQMPKMDGFETLKYIRKEKTNKDTPVIFISAIYKDDFYKIKGIQSGAIDFITKPFIDEVIIGKVNIFLTMYMQKQIIVKQMLKIDNTNDYLTQLVNTLDSIIVCIDDKGKILFWNHKAEEFTGKSITKSNGKLVNIIFNQIPIKLNKILNNLSQNKKYIEEKIKTYINDKESYFNLFAYPMIRDNNEGIIRIDNVTYQMQINEMMIQSEKMLSIGGLAAGMAHEINNPLAGIIQNVQVMKNRLSNATPKNIKIAKQYDIDFDSIINFMDDRKIFNMMNMIMDSGNRASEIVQNMLSFSRKSVYDSKLNQVTTIIDNTIILASNDYNLKKKYDFRKIKIIKDFENNLPQISCEFTKIQQVFLNILKNGAEAMVENKGKMEDFQFNISVKKLDNMIEIQIKDNGPGMSEKIRKRVFEPFFTTKKLGIGTGLGLSVSYYIITDDHNGNMRVESEEGKGTNFIITLPFKKGNNII